MTTENTFLDILNLRYKLNSLYHLSPDTGFYSVRMPLFDLLDTYPNKVGIYVNTVNLVGVMGKGVALEFKKRFDHNFHTYKKWCRSNPIEYTNLCVKEKTNFGYIYVINTPTKLHWKEKSKESHVFLSFIYLLCTISDLIEKDENITYAIIPPLGCGLGGLQYEKIEEFMIYILSRFNNDDHIDSLVLNDIDYIESLIVSNLNYLQSKPLYQLKKINYLLTNK